MTRNRADGLWKITFEPTHSEPYVLVNNEGSEICRFQSPLGVRHYLEGCRLPAAEAEKLLTKLQISGEIECPPPEEPE